MPFPSFNALLEPVFHEVDLAETSRDTGTCMRFLDRLEDGDGALVMRPGLVCTATQKCHLSSARSPRLPGRADRR